MLVEEMSRGEKEGEETGMGMSGRYIYTDICASTSDE